MMDAAPMITGCLLYVMLGYISCIGTYWKEMNLLRNYQPVYDSEFESTEVVSLFSCMSHCSMTNGCNYISYVLNTSVCLRHHTFAGFKYQPSSSIWSLLKNDGCPEGWYSFKSHCFLFPEVKLLWDDSYIYCQTWQAQLAELDTGPKDVFIKKIVQERPEFLRRTWFGGSDIIEEGKWVWNTTGSPMKNYTNWCGIQPNNEAGNLFNADCACFLKSSDFNCWHDCACERDGYPLCETQNRN